MTGPIGPGSSYIRVSRKVQITERQRSAIAAWAAHHGVTIAHAFEDQGSRDKSEQRADLQKLLGYVEEGHIRWVVVEDLDRFGVKDAYELAAFIYNLRRNGCQLWSVADDKCISEGDDSTVLGNVIRGMTSEKEQYVKGERAISAKLQQARKGTWVGGHVPYGCDVICVRNDEIAWRMIIEGRDRRIVLEGGKSTRYDGPNAVPAHNKVTDQLFLAPSVIEERIRNVVDIFTWFAEESITAGKIADRLNARSESPVYSKTNRWYAVLVTGILKNPVYMGLPTYNKNAHGRFFQFQEGRISKAPRRNNYYAVTGRTRGTSDWIAPEKPVFEPIVPAEIFTRVQAKLAAARGKRSPRAPKDDRLWLAGLVYCGKCGEKMAGAMYAQEKGDQRSFLCSTAMRYGRNHNASGCRSHRVRHADLEKYVGRYLAEAGQELTALQAEMPGQFREFEGVLRDLRGRGIDLQERAKRFIEESIEAGGVAGEIASRESEVIATMSPNQPPDPDSAWTSMTPTERAQFFYGYVFQAYGEVYEARRGALEAELAAKRGELELRVERFALLDLQLPRAIQVAKDKMAKLEAEIGTLEARLEPLIEYKHALSADIAATKERFLDAVRATQGQDNRRKAEAIRQVVGKITCHYEYKQHGQQTRSVLVGVDIEPIAPGSSSFRNTISPGPG